MRSVGSMLEMLDGLSGTNDLTAWESDFVSSVVQQTDGAKKTSRLSEKQVEQIERIYRKHFA